MAIEDIIADPFLQSVLSTASVTREQCMSLLAAIQDNSLTHDSFPPDQTQAEYSKRRKLLNAHLAMLRGQTRSAIFSVRQTKLDTAEARSEIDTLHLQLQNLYYEQRHLRGEISACESYDHKYQQLPLLPLDRFLEEQPDLAEMDENALMIARIEHEKKERETLEAARQELLKKKQGLIADNKKRKDDLASLDNDLEKFIDAAKPIQKIFEKEY